MGFRKILVAVDDSAIAANAAAVGAELAKSLRAELAFVHAVDPQAGYVPDSGVPAINLLAQAELAAKRLLAEHAARSALQPAPQQFLHVGKPGDSILRTARDWPADLIVIGSHGRGGIQRALLGSVAEEVTRHAACPVLIVRGA